MTEDYLVALVLVTHQGTVGEHHQRYIQNRLYFRGGTYDDTAKEDSAHICLSIGVS